MPWLLNQASSMAVVSLLRAAWIAGTLPIVAASIPSSKINVFRRLLLQLAGRGKIMDSSSRKLSVPQKYFCHFYVVGVIWTAFLIVATLLYAYETTAIVSDSFMYSSIATPLTRVSNEFSLHESHSSLSEYRYGIWESVFLLLLMEAHVLRRLIESKDRMRVTEFDLWPLLQLKWYAWIGAAFFFWGWIHQHRCHAILGSLRENGGKVDDYVIPEGDWFEHVSSPHYLAEIVIYCGLVIASGVSDITIWLVVGFVVANLALAAGETHRWYIGKFDNYPRNRYAIIPLIY